VRAPALTKQMAATPAWCAVQERPSFSEDSPEVRELQDQLRELGPAPQRLRRSMEDIQALRAAAAGAVARDEVSAAALLYSG
jgi:hypothetical protein